MHVFDGVYPNNFRRKKNPTPVFLISRALVMIIYKQFIYIKIYNKTRQDKLDIRD